MWQTAILQAYLSIFRRDCISCEISGICIIISSIIIVVVVIIIIIIVIIIIIIIIIVIVIIGIGKCKGTRLGTMT